jgi:hypothetical protein
MTGVAIELFTGDMPSQEVLEWLVLDQGRANRFGSI